MVALAVATNTMPSAWLAEPDEAIATALDIMAEQAEQAERGSRG